MTNSESVPNSAKTNQVNKLTKKLGASQLTLVAVHIVSLVAAPLIAAMALTDGVFALTRFGGGVSALTPFIYALTSAAAIVVAGFTHKKITEKDMLDKGYSFATAALVLALIAGAVSAAATIVFALFAIGGGGEVQSTLWLDKFLPTVVSAAAAAGVLFVVKKLQTNSFKSMSTFNYAVLGLAGAALILTIIATFVGFYGKSKCESLSNFDSFSKYMSECADF